MEPVKITLVISLFVALSLAICWLDAKKGWQLVEWINGRCSNPFKQKAANKVTRNEADKDALIAQLTERVQVLEKIVTEPSYELNKKINQL